MPRSFGPQGRDELFLDRIPVDLACQTHGEHAKVGHAGRTMPHTHRADRLLSRLDAVYEVGHVIAAHVYARRTVRQFVRQEPRIAGVNLATCHPDPAICTHKLDTVMLPVLVDHTILSRRLALRHDQT